ncbi:hypothetical protein TELCIR_20714, partial [Teladorsagia circumcincta]
AYYFFDRCGCSPFSYNIDRCRCVHPTKHSSVSISTFVYKLTAPTTFACHNVRNAKSSATVSSTMLITHTVLDSVTEH